MRALPFRVVFIMLLAKSTKSNQLTLNELLPKLAFWRKPVSGAAYTKARAKLRHTAFIALNKVAVLEVMYQKDSKGRPDYKTKYGHRILAIDGSRIILPYNKQTILEFGTEGFNNTQGNGGEGVVGEHASALVSSLYDVLNNVALEAKILPRATYEVDAAVDHLKLVEMDDLLLLDRGYASYLMLAAISRSQANVVLRCSRSSFAQARTMLSGGKVNDQTVILKPTRKFIDKYGSALEDDELPKQITVRFVRVILDTGEVEVLATTLLDQVKYPTEIFKEIYWLRWGVETFYNVLKSRLSLDNFSGTSPESIRQDFHASVLLCGIETILTEDVTSSLGKKDTINPLKVNKAVSFNAIKNRAFELFMSNKSENSIMKELTELFLTNPTSYRKDKNPPRRQSSAHRSLGYARRKKKTVY
jgi:Transposase DDE domain